MGGTGGPVGATDRRTHAQAYDDCGRTVGCRWWCWGCWGIRRSKTTSGSDSCFPSGAGSNFRGGVCVDRYHGWDEGGAKYTHPGEAWEYPL